MMSERRLVVDSEKQEALLHDNGRVIRQYVVSTSAKGLGCEPDSSRTPHGRLAIAEKIGHDLPEGAVLRGRQATGEVWSSNPKNPLAASDEDLVLTRVLWLSGKEPHNANTLDRYIYLHGTNHERRLGEPASQGCIRFSNKDIVELFDLLQVGDEVEVV
jgi:lipoprotein-anchoring transpeptidase ErfK/SrfK